MHDDINNNNISKIETRNKKRFNANNNNYYDNA